MVVPTGRVLVRFQESDDVANHEHELRAAGYALDEVLPYASNTAWLRATNGSITDALHSIDGLRKVAGVAALEPEMIGTSAKRE